MQPKYILFVSQEDIEDLSSDEIYMVPSHIRDQLNNPISLTEVALCEAHKINPRYNQPYIYRVIEHCQGCEEAAEYYREQQNGIVCLECRKLYPFTCVSHKPTKD